MNAVNYSTDKKATNHSLASGISSIKGCNKYPTLPLGVVNLNVIVNGFPSPHQFICIPDEHTNETTILGILWM
ncbi:hypothetical protein, partial [Enterobacter cloacae complex sp. GF14B]|uniref:hypothetical protein n=1 Tax=Enterobacter cloacae complex sp. GF14B TaxID=2511982 RepID=UPI001CA54C12